ncbi:MAG: hypothetical protein U5L45_20010 [Saprospiraceae bacterium]|nr:hypothetical protein [Saprospiraceae bacterium]
MTKIELKQSFLIVFSLASVSTALWLFEMTKVIGWSSLDWLEADLISPYVICSLAAICFMTPIVLKYKKIDGKIILTFLTLTMINIAAFFLAELVLKGVFSELSFFSEKAGTYTLGIITFIGFALGYYIVTHYLIVNMPRLYVFIFASTEVLMFVLAVITSSLTRGFGGQSYFSDLIKMGYPQFWICILLGLSGIFILDKNLKEG